MPIVYLDQEDVAELHERTIDSFGWLGWFHDRQQLGSLLQHVANDEYYPSLSEKAAHIFFWIVKFHCFIDWNKRTAILATSLFLESNGIEIADFVIKMEDIAIWVAKNELEKRDVVKILRSMFESFGHSDVP